MKLEDFKGLKEDLKPGSLLANEGESWGLFTFVATEAASLQADLGFRARLNGVQHMGRGLQQVQSIKKYRKTACEMISFLIAIGKLGLPKFSDVDDGSRRNRLASGEPPLASDYLERIVLAICSFSALDSTCSDMRLFLQMFCLKLNSDMELEPLSPQLVSQRTSAVIYVIKDMWCALRSYMQNTSCRWTVEEQPEVYKVVNRGEMDTCKPMIAIFTIRKLTGKAQYTPTVLFQVDNSASPEIPLAAWVNNKYITTTVIAAVIYCVVRSIKALHKAFFSLLEVPHIGDIIDGKYQIEVDDAGPSLKWTTVVAADETGGIGTPVVSAQIEAALTEKLRGLPRDEYDSYVRKHLEANKKMLAAVETSQPCRGNELNNVTYTDFEGGGKKKLSFLQGPGDCSDTISLGVISKGKKKFEGDNTEDTTMLGLLIPDVSLATVLHISARRALIAAGKHHYPDSSFQDKERYLFLMLLQI